MSIGWFLLSATIGMVAVLAILCVVDWFQFKRDQTDEILRGLREPTWTERRKP